jgi:hypothetical protein
LVTRQRRAGRAKSGDGKRRRHDTNPVHVALPSFWMKPSPALDRSAASSQGTLVTVGHCFMTLMIRLYDSLCL